MTEVSEATEARSQKFASAYAEWIEAMAAVAKMDGGIGMEDEEANAAGASGWNLAHVSLLRPEADS
jgi:hypothetical protein